ncbi:MAG: hypothetical protein NTZ05_02990, partial [Chloroflexi bacterium]|nr:hypothetical protein [Chloroflexota bacterium]
VPVSVAGLGLREGAYVVLLGRYGVPDEQGLALALAVFGMILAQGLAGGVVDLMSGLGRIDDGAAAPAPAAITLPQDR